MAMPSTRLVKNQASIQSTSERYYLITSNKRKAFEYSLCSDVNFWALELDLEEIQSDSASIIDDEYLQIVRGPKLDDGVYAFEDTSFSVEAFSTAKQELPGWAIKYWLKSSEVIWHLAKDSVAREEVHIGTFRVSKGKIGQLRKIKATVSGRIRFTEARKKTGLFKDTFGYDGIFVPDTAELSYQALGADKLNHCARAKAIAKLFNEDVSQ
jgi:inosine/xanthosine triphosphate pyrophosphatase family protein